MKFDSLRFRLVLSHILPLLVMIPLMGIALVYVIETRVILPQLATKLAGDARLLKEITRAEYELWGNPYFFELMLSRVQLEPGIRVMFLTPDGRLLYSSDTGDAGVFEMYVDAPGLLRARRGEDSISTNYSIWRANNVLIDALSPVINSQQQLVGIVRVTYRVASLYELFLQFRELIGVVLVMALLVGGVLGLMLAVSIGKPVQRVTHAIYDIASGARGGMLLEQGPEEVRSLSRAVNYLVERLNGMEIARRQLLANLVHELGRPLGALRSAIHALSKGAGDDPQLLYDLTTGMDEETARLQHVLEDLAHLHDQVLGTLEMNLKPIALSEWLPRMLVPWQEAALEKKLVWKAEIPSDLPVVQADPVRLAQIIGNLASNAVKYTPSGKSVSVSAGVEGAWVWMRVSDSGPGISPEEQNRIFEPFYRGDTGRRIKQGMGLGLSIARDLALAHGGRLEVESQPGAGSRFTAWIPVTAEKNTPLAPHNL
jgi:two-component system, OmpR family, sensor histidine kinase BaeS